MEELLGTLIEEARLNREEARLNRETMTSMWRDLSSGLKAVNRRLDLLTEAVRHGAVINDAYEGRISSLEERVDRLENERR